MINFILTPLGKIASALAMVAALYAALMTNNAYQRSQGAKAERQAAVERTAELIKKRAKDDDAISRMDNAAICVELGGNWVRDHCE